MAKSKDIQIPIALAVKIELFKRGCFDFITVKDGKKHEKQEKALQILTDIEHVELLYGGAAGGVVADVESRCPQKAARFPPGGSLLPAGVANVPRTIHAAVRTGERIRQHEPAGQGAGSGGGDRRQTRENTVGTRLRNKNKNAGTSRRLMLIAVSFL